MLLILGVLLWAGTHSIRHMAPGFRAHLGETRAKLFVTATSLIAIVLMVIGYRHAPTAVVYDLGPDTIYLNNLLMVLAVALMIASAVKSRVVNILRHPMLVGVVLWAVAHLLIAGEFRAIVLFGGLTFWAVASMIVINVKELKWNPPGGTAKGDVLLVIITAALVALIGAIHIWLGFQPFGG